MAWSSTRGSGTAAKYRTKEHQARRAVLVKQLKAGHVLECAAVECVFESRAIVNSNGMEPDGLNLGHLDDGVGYRGPEHRACNLRDGARRGNKRSRGMVTTKRWVL